MRDHVITDYLSRSPGCSLFDSDTVWENNAEEVKTRSWMIQQEGTVRALECLNLLPSMLGSFAGEFAEAFFCHPSSAPGMIMRAKDKCRSAMMEGHKKQLKKSCAGGSDNSRITMAPSPGSGCSHMLPETI